MTTNLRPSVTITGTDLAVRKTLIATISRHPFPTNVWPTIPRGVNVCHWCRKLFAEHEEMNAEELSGVRFFCEFVQTRIIFPVKPEVELIETLTG